MALTFGDNISYQGKKPLDSRHLFKTIADMKAYSENYLPPLAICQNEEDGNLYEYNTNNTVDSTTGKWRKFTSDGSGGSGIKNYETTETYNIDDFCCYDNYIWKCNEDNVTGTWDETKWIQIGDKTEIYSLDDVKNLVGLTTEEIITLSSIIDDSVVELTKTYSSSKIYADLQKVLDDSKAYTMKELANIISASYKVVTDMSTQTDKSVIYLIANALDSYDMYILEDDLSATKIGTTEINVNLEIDPTTKHWILDGTDLGVVAEGQDGKTPSITMNADNTFEVFKLDINDGYGNITTTPNLMAHDEVSVPLNGFYKIYVEDGHLKLICEDGATPPPLGINDKGHLIYTVGGTIQGTLIS